MASQSNLIEKTVNEALEQLEKFAPAEYKKLNAHASMKQKVIQAARETVSETFKLNEEFHDQPQDIANRLSKHLSEHRIMLIRGGLDIPTFQMEIAKKDDGNHWVTLSSGGKEFLPPLSLIEVEHTEWSRIMQYASILVEAIMLVMSLVGISGIISNKLAIDKAATAIRSTPKLIKSLERFVEDWDKAGDSRCRQAVALYNLITASKAAGIMCNIIKTLYTNAAWNEWLVPAIKVVAMVAASIATDGVALIAEVTLTGFTAVAFAEKVPNIMRLSRLEQTL